MPHPSEHNRHVPPTSWIVPLAVLFIIAGCARGTSDKRAEQPDQHVDSQPAPPAADMVRDELPAAAASKMEQRPPVKPRMAEYPARIAKSAAETPRAAKTLRHRQTETLSSEEFPAMAAMEESSPVEISSIESFIPPDTAVNEPGEHLSHLPAGAQHQREQGFATVQVFYATDRQRGDVPLSAYEFTGQKHALVALGGCSLLLIALAAINVLRGRGRSGAVSALAAGISACLAAALVVVGQANIEKHGVTYTGDRGRLTRGVCQVTVPDAHRRGMVERPSLLRFEVRENQQKHIVLTNAIELAAADFNKRLLETVSTSPDRDLLVFIHGYNVDFDSAVRRTAQIAVDLPFEGVPVCYSWPSQASLIGYSIDENNADWTSLHLKQFLLELAQESGAESINVIAHSMGNRAMTAAMQQISWQLDNHTATPFDRIVLAAPDVDADRFRRDFAPSLLQVANQVTLYASSDDQALVASKQVHGYPRAGESGANIVVVPGIETIDVSGIDLSLLGHSYYGDNESMLRDLYEVVRARLPAPKRGLLIPKHAGPLTYWQLAQRHGAPAPGARR